MRRAFLIGPSAFAYRFRDGGDRYLGDMNPLASNHIGVRSPTTKTVSQAELARRVSNATYYVSCWMTRAQIRKMRAKKVIFNNLSE